MSKKGLFSPLLFNKFLYHQKILELMSVFKKHSINTKIYHSICIDYYVLLSLQVCTHNKITVSTFRLPLFISWVEVPLVSIFHRSIVTLPDSCLITLVVVCSNETYWKYTMVDLSRMQYPPLELHCYRK